MDTLDNFSPMDTTGFIVIQSIRYVYTSGQIIQNNINDIQAQEVRSSEGGGGRQPEPRISSLPPSRCETTGLNKLQRDSHAELAIRALSNNCINEIKLNMSAIIWRSSSLDAPDTHGAAIELGT